MIKKAAEFLMILTAFLLMGAAVFTYIGPRFGWNVSAVLSGSMEPALHTGSLIVICPVAPETLREGDIITFRTVAVSGGTVTHRISSIIHNSPVMFETKGDANQNIDVFTVSERDLAGKVVVHIPLLGYLTQFMKTTTGFFVTIVIPGTLLLVFYIWSFMKELGAARKKRDKRTEVVK